MFYGLKSRINTGSTLIHTTIVLRNIFMETFQEICVKVGNDWGLWMCAYTFYSLYQGLLQGILLYKLNSFKQLV